MFPRPLEFQRPFLLGFDQLAVVIYNRYDKFYLQTKVYYNKSYDDFILTKEDPRYFQNITYTEKYGIDFLLGLSITKYFILTTIVNQNNEEYDSLYFGKHSRKNISLGNEVLYNQKKIGVNFSLRNDFYFSKENIHSPGIGFYYWIINKLKLRGSYGLSYRMPSFTELYYKSPSNIGDENLKAGKNNSCEIGTDWVNKLFIFKNTLFHRREFDFIDWVKSTEKSPWYAKNINEIKFWGIENEFILFLLHDIKLIIRNSYISAITKKDYISKYGLNYTKNQTAFVFNFPLILRIHTSINVVYKVRKDHNYALTSIYLKKDIFQYSSIFIKGKNIFNQPYEEIAGIPQPGRIFIAGVEIHI